MINDRKAVVLTPGPVHLHRSVLEAVEPIHHRTDRFRELIKDVEHSLRELLGTVNPVYMVTSSGTGVMEMAIANLTSPDTRVLVIAGGKFGKRWEELGRVYGCNVETIAFSPGARFDIGRILNGVERFQPERIAITHVESSSGTLFPVKEFAESLPDKSPLLIVDAIASLGVEELEMDSWGIDVVISAGQKALATPPGISFICMNEKARGISEQSGRSLYYFSAPRYQAGYEEGDTPFTPAIQTVQILKYTLDIQKGIGWENMRNRHRRSSMAVISALETLGMALLSEQPAASVQAMVVPEGCDSGEFIHALSERYGVIIAGGQGQLRGKIIRTGYTGLYHGETLALVVRAIGELLAGEGFEPDIEAALIELEVLMRQKAIF